MRPPRHNRARRRATARTPRPAAPTRRLIAALRLAGAWRRTAFSGLAMLFIAAIALATTVPSTALTATDAAKGESVYALVEPVEELEPQSVAISSAELAPVDHEEYTVEAAPPPLYSTIASIGVVPLVVSPVVVWPTGDHARVSSGFGPRSAPCGGCSTFHDGIDFTPGNGAAIGSIADGVVIASTDAGGGLGVMVEVQHNIDGDLVTSLYAHMQYGSRAVSVGDRVTAGQYLGAVGSTGQSTGPHLHLEVYYSDGVRIDGYAWLAARA